VTDFLSQLADNAQQLVEQGYYDSKPATRIYASGVSLRRSLAKANRFPIIAEVKPRSPSAGEASSHQPLALMEAYLRGGAAGLSILTEPNHFKGRLEDLEFAAAKRLPVIMKDIVVSKRQVHAAARRGANAVLVIQRLFSERLTVVKRDQIISEIHGLGMEALLEVTSLRELSEAKGSGADLIGINQRDLSSLRVDLGRGIRLLPVARRLGVPVLVMSGIRHRMQVEGLRDAGAAGVLVGEAFSMAPDPLAALQGLAVVR
jgi:indole-3-glycerol phosphate synthase